MNKEHDATAHHDDVDEVEFNEFEEEIDIDEDQNYSFGYQMGFDAGYIEGYEQGQTTLALESESTIYNKSLDDVLEQVSKFNFELKDTVIEVLQSLRRA